MADSIINTRVDSAVKAQADALFTNLGITTSAAINIFLRKAIREQGIPFAVTLDTPNAETIRAMSDADQGIGLSKKYKSAKAMLADILEGGEDARGQIPEPFQAGGAADGQAGL